MLRFVVQQHAARTLHFDFRLELAGVLVSWAVPKGPSLAPKVRRLAVRVDDHALEHADFEGILPDSPPGRGAVLIWDRGTWTPEGDGSAALAAGKLAFTLSGEKLRGRWHLLRTEPQGKQESWLLFKGRDELADDVGDVVVDKPASVVSGRTIADLLAMTAKLALVLALIGCSTTQDTTCKCTPGAATLDILPQLRQHVEMVARGANNRDIKMVDDEIRLQVSRACQPCASWVGDRLTVDEMFPMARLRDTARATCLGLVLRDGSTAYGDARPSACRH